MAIVRIQTTSAEIGVAPDVTANLGSPVTAGNLIVAVYHTRTPGGHITPTGWTSIREFGQENSSLEMYYQVASGTEGSSFTFSSANTTYQSLSILEYSGVDMVDKVAIAGQRQYDGPYLSGETALSAQNCLALSAIGLQGKTVWTGSWTNGFTQRTVAGNGGGSANASAHAVADKFITIPEYSSTETDSTIGRPHEAVIVTFKLSTAPPSPAAPSEFGTLHYNGTQFRTAKRGLKAWTGTAWQLGNPKIWDGTSWQLAQNDPYAGFLPWSTLSYTSATDVTLNANVIIDVAVAQVKSLIIPDGYTLAFDPNITVRLESTNNIVVNGIFEMKPVNATKSHTVLFPTVDESLYVGGGNIVIDTDVGLWVMETGTLNAVGASKTPWTYLSGSATAGSSTVSVTDAAGWKVGDEIAIAPFEAATVANQWTHYDERTVSAISGTGPYLITLNSPLTYNHTAVVIESVTHRAEVMNLSRNVKISGTVTGRAHMMFVGNGGHDLQYVEASFMGPRQPTGESDYTENVRGRYTFHFHHGRGKTAGMQVVGCVVHKTGGHSFVFHDCDGIHFDRCISHDTFDDAYWYDTFALGKGIGDPNEPGPHDNFLDGCIASLVKVSPVFRGIRMAGFMLGQGGGNRIEGCSVFGNQGNTDAGGYVWAEASVSVWLFQNNKSHNNKANGIFTWQNTSRNHVVKDTVLFRNGNAGLKHGAYVNTYSYGPNIVSTGNGFAALIISAQNGNGIFSPQEFVDSVFDGSNIVPYAITNGEHSLQGTGYAEMRNCTVKGYLNQAIGIIQNATEPDQTAFIDCTFSTGEATWLYMSSSCHIDSNIQLRNINSSGLNYDCRRADYVDATYSYYAPWNCMRKSF